MSKFKVGDQVMCIDPNVLAELREAPLTIKGFNGDKQAICSSSRIGGEFFLNTDLLCGHLITREAATPTNVTQQDYSLVKLYRADKNGDPLHFVATYHTDEIKELGLSCIEEAAQLELPAGHYVAYFGPATLGYRQPDHVEEVFFTTKKTSASGWTWHRLLAMMGACFGGYAGAYWLCQYYWSQLPF